MLSTNESVWAASSYIRKHNKTVDDYEVPQNSVYSKYYLDEKIIIKTGNKPKKRAQEIAKICAILRRNDGR